MRASRWPGSRASTRVKASWAACGKPRRSPPWPPSASTAGPGRDAEQPRRRDPLGPAGRSPARHSRSARQRRASTQSGDTRTRASRQGRADSTRPWCKATRVRPSRRLGSSGCSRRAESRIQAASGPPAQSQQDRSAKRDGRDRARLEGLGAHFAFRQGLLSSSQALQGLASPRHGRRPGGGPGAGTARSRAGPRKGRPLRQQDPSSQGMGLPRRASWPREHQPPPGPRPGSPAPAGDPQGPAGSQAPCPEGPRCTTLPAGGPGWFRTAATLPSVSPFLGGTAWAGLPGFVLLPSPRTLPPWTRPLPGHFTGLVQLGVGTRRTRAQGAWAPPHPEQEPFPSRATPRGVSARNVGMPTRQPLDNWHNPSLPGPGLPCANPHHWNAGTLPQDRRQHLGGPVRALIDEHHHRQSAGGEPAERAGSRSGRALERAAWACPEVSRTCRPTQPLPGS